MAFLDKLFGGKTDSENEGKPVAQSRISSTIAVRNAGAIDLMNCTQFSLTKISGFGTVVCSILSMLHTSVNAFPAGTVCYTPVNMGPDDVLKTAKDGTNWGTFRNASGESKMVKWVKVNGQEFRSDRCRRLSLQ